MVLRFSLSLTTLLPLLLKVEAFSSIVTPASRRRTQQQDLLRLFDSSSSLNGNAPDEDDAIPDKVSDSGEESSIQPAPQSPSSAARTASQQPDSDKKKKKKSVIVIGAGWGGLSAAYSLAKQDDYDITVIDAAPRVGGLVRDGFTSMKGLFPAEAGQHGMWDAYDNIFRLLDQDLGIIDDVLTGYAEQGQYSKHGGLEAVWPVYRNQPTLPTGLAQLAYTRFENLPLVDRISALPLVLAFSEFDDSEAAWHQYDNISFYDLCVKLGVSKRCYDEAFEPMILTGLFAPGKEVSAAAALGMAYFFVLSRQAAFDVRWAKGNVGDVIFDPWRKRMEELGVKFQCSTFVTGFELNEAQTAMTKLKCTTTTDKEELEFEPDQVVFAVGASAYNAMVRNSSVLAKVPEFRRFANLRGTSVLATRLYFDQHIHTPYTANACFGFDQDVGMTFFNIGELHQMNLRSDDTAEQSTPTPQTIIEVDYYHSNSLLVMSDEDLVDKVKADLDCILGPDCQKANVLDAAIVRLPNAVNWYFPGSYKDMPDLKSQQLSNVYFAGDLVRTRHGSWSQEKAYVTGIEVANRILNRPSSEGIVPLPQDEAHVALGRSAVAAFKTLLGMGNPEKGPSLANFLF